MSYAELEGTQREAFLGVQQQQSRELSGAQ